MGVPEGDSQGEAPSQDRHLCDAGREEHSWAQVAWGQGERLGAWEEVGVQWEDLRRPQTSTCHDSSHSPALGWAPVPQRAGVGSVPTPPTCT